MALLFGRLDLIVYRLDDLRDDMRKQTERTERAIENGEARLTSLETSRTQALTILALMNLGWGFLALYLLKVI